MLSSGSCRSFVLVDQATQNRSTLDPFIAEVRYGMSRSRWAKVVGTVRPSTVVMPNVLREHQTQVPLTEDQRVQRSRRQPPFGKRLRAPRPGHAQAVGPGFAYAVCAGSRATEITVLRGRLQRDGLQLQDALVFLISRHRNKPEIQPAAALPLLVGGSALDCACHVDA